MSSALPLHERPYDVLLFGATGFTGQLVAEQLARNAAGENCRLALAGREMAKLETLRASLPDSGRDIGLLTADVRDPDALRQLAAQGRVLISTVGPYNWYGEAVVRACLAAGTHYLDITGEPAFVNRVFSTCHQEAMEKGLCLVNCCGFDSIPADLGAWLTARALPREAPKAVRAYLRTNAAFSGGTWTTAIHALYQRSREKQRTSSGPRHPDAPRMDLRIHYRKDLQRWAIPMPVVDPHIVKRSARHLPADYGEAFSYGQFFTVGSLWRVLQIVVPIGLVMLLVRFGPVRRWLFGRFPPGTGPDPEKRARSRFEVRVFGEGGGHRAETTIAGGDPGYDETAKMLSQSAFVLLQRHREGRLVPGVRTPVEAFGQDLVQRLRNRGIRIEQR
jgi:short subunit dehydrogenase-like uncharacterized protein